eukprot:TRINITY_DN47450_c0_g2_i2.p1 TRINITY_DN47450_c0_g2~~TRINITY_DN47450_c0_g2_i2.p1  ORF type:complete len:268 (+),score=41.08 TRINITY_DN47450_c0_g2_i2:79-882(+)
MLRTMNSGERPVQLLGGVTAPCRQLQPAESPSPLIVFGHGLNDKKEDDEPMLRTALAALAGKASESSTGDDAARTWGAPNLIIYDARGHGGSTGWQDLGPEQFHWRSLAVDMLQVAAAHSWIHPTGTKTFLGGYSMGANSALWAALMSPTGVAGLILLSCTTGWELRAGRRAALVEKAESLMQDNPHKGQVLLGAARADLPPKEDLKAIKAPALIIAARDDPVHPAEMAETLAGLLPNAKMVLTDHKADLPKVFASAVAEWLPEQCS